MISNFNQIFYHKVKNKYRMSAYCRFNVICVSSSCKARHLNKYSLTPNKDFTSEHRVVVKKLYDELTGEILAHKEEVKPKTANCRHHLLCFEVDCIYNHSGVAQEGRKKLIKAFKKHIQNEKAAAKIQNDIELIKSGESVDWNDM